MSPKHVGPGSEDHAQAAYTLWLENAGWTVTQSKREADITAVHPEHGLLIGEAKGDIGDSVGTDLDEGYGQLLRRMSQSPTARYVLVVPAGKALTAALRVSSAVRARLGIELHVVEADGTVRIWEEP
jgi:hypothetical protein